MKPVWTRPGIINGICKVHKTSSIIDHHFDLFCQQLIFLPIKLAKILVPILKYLTSNEYTVKDSITFAEESAKQDSVNFL